MATALPVDEFLAEARRFPLVDVRSPGEYLHGHIPGAINIPLFTDEERARVGTLYKQKGAQEALLAGLEIVGPKMPGFVREACLIAREGRLLVHCWRGGMRSGSFAWLMETAGLQVTTLRSGYKAYRRQVLSAYDLPLQLRIVGGETGSGKTEILQHIARAGEQVLDLEAIAHHRGSAFGALGQEPQPSVEQFENNLYDAFSRLDQSRPIWLEDESRSIGRVYVPNPLWAQMEQAPVYRIRIPQEVRLKRLVRDYGSFPKEELEAAILRISKRLGDLSTRQALEALHEGRLEETARISLAYYDKAYNFPHAKRNYAGVRFVDGEGDDAALNAQLILSCVNSTAEA